MHHFVQSKWERKLHIGTVKAIFASYRRCTSQNRYIKQKNRGVLALCQNQVQELKKKTGRTNNLEKRNTLPLINR
jgi:hypothetical protein